MPGSAQRTGIANLPLHYGNVLHLWFMPAEYQLKWIIQPFRMVTSFITGEILRGKFEQSETTPFSRF
jgi:hypothetical protein